MQKPDLRTREAKAAQYYMERKGYKNVRPKEVIKVLGQDVWYFYYDVPDGLVELEVWWIHGDWGWNVTAFREADDRTSELVGR